MDILNHETGEPLELSHDQLLKLLDTIEANEPWAEDDLDLDSDGE